MPVLYKKCIVGCRVEARLDCSSYALRPRSLAALSR